MQKISLTDIDRFNFNLTVTFLALWQERSVSAAARRLSLSQSAVSTALIKLRQITGDPLFVRSRGEMVPTPRAAAMAGPLENGVDLIHQAFCAESRFDPATSRQRFTIGMSDDYQLAAGPRISRALAEAAPHASIVFRQANRYTVDAAFEAGEIDFAVIAKPYARSWLQAEQIGESGYACLYDALACGDGAPVSLEPYLSLPHVLVSYSGREGIVDQVLHRMGRERRVQTALTHFSALPPFLTGVRAVATIPAHAARALAAISGLTCGVSPVDLGRYPVSLMWKRETDNPWFRSVLRAVFTEVLK